MLKIDGQMSLWFISKVRYNPCNKHNRIMMLLCCIGPGTVRYRTVQHSRIMGYFYFIYNLSAVDRGCRPLLVARSSRLPPLPLRYLASDCPSRTHHPMLFFLFTINNICSLARWVTWSSCSRSWSRYPSRHPTSAWSWSRRSLHLTWG